MGGGRKTKHDYSGPGSFDRVLEAAIALADADTDDDAAFHRCKMRLVKATAAYWSQHLLTRKQAKKAAAQLGAMWLDFKQDDAR